MNIIPFAFSIHPGDILRTEFMEPRGLDCTVPLVAMSDEAQSKMLDRT